jgi:hypothetical protein
LALEADIKSMKKNVYKRNQEGHQKNAHKKGKEQKAPADEPKWMDEPPLKADIKMPFKPVFWKTKQWCCCHKHTGGKCAGVWHVHKLTEHKGKASIFKNKHTDKGPAAKRFKTNPNQAKGTLTLAKACKTAAEVQEDEDDTDMTKVKSSRKEDPQIGWGTPKSSLSKRHAT